MCTRTHTYVRMLDLKSQEFQVPKQKQSKANNVQKKQTNKKCTNINLKQANRTGREGSEQAWARPPCASTPIYQQQ